MCPRCFHLQKAAFEEFVRKEGNRVRFAASEPAPGGQRFRARHWPVFQRPKRWRRTRWTMPALNGACHVKGQRALNRAIAVEVARRWLPGNPLHDRYLRIGDAVLERYWARERAREPVWE